MHKNIFVTLTTLVLVLVLAASGSAERKVSLIGPPSSDKPQSEIIEQASPGGGEAAYVGTIRAYVVEPIGRWLDNIGGLYHYNVLAIPVVANVNIPDGGTWTQSVNWNVNQLAGVDNIMPGNIAVITVVFNVAGTVTQSYPNYYFNAHYVDGAARATIGYPGVNGTTVPGFTHNVFVEEGTRTT